MTKKIKKAILPVAGVGTRLLPITKVIPKELLPIGNKPIIQHLVEEAVSAGITDIVMVISKGKEAIADYFDRDAGLEATLEEKGKTDLLEDVQRLHNIANISYVRQPEPLGDGHAILCAKELIGDEPFLVLFGDDLIQNERSAAQQLIDIYNDTGTSVIALNEVDPQEVSKYGVIKGNKVDNIYKVETMVEKPAVEEAPSNMAIVGKYVCTPKIFEHLAKRPSGSGEIRLIDALLELLKEESIHALQPEGKRYDTGTGPGYFEASIAFANGDDDYHQIIKRFVQAN